MPVGAILLWGVAAPAALAALAWCVGRRPWRGDRPPPGGGEPSVRCWEAQAVALAFLIGYTGQLGPPRWPGGEVPPGAQDWLVWIVLAVGLAYARPPRRLRALFSRPLIAAGALAPLLLPMIRHHWDAQPAIGWFGGLWAGLLACWWSGDALARRAPAAAAGVLVMTGAALALCAGLSGSAKLAQAAAPVCAALGTLWVLDLWRHASAPATGTVALAVLAWFGLGVTAFFYSSLPAGQALLLGSAPLAALASSTVVGPREGFGATVVPLAAAALPLAAALFLAWSGFEPDPYGY
ncbi:MAG: hypothetical protein CMJ84_15730 [Planctomycetes bacterium]|nr:hypothetical protein [Planctomycetota bacterium]MDP6410474.1 hypothetical protein [Planctomycetota bacterium]